jgi:trk system potassium uptake protein TrkA
VGDNSPLRGQSIKEVGLRENTGVTVLSVRKAGEISFNVNPEPDTKVGKGDVLILIGTPEQMSRLEAML